MAITLVLLVALVLGVLLVIIGGLLLFILKTRLPGAVLMGFGILMVVLSFLAFLSLVITSRVMG